MGREGRLYNPSFYRELEQTRESAREILPIIFELLRPASVIDLGCGAGQWLSVAIELGVSDVLGVDGAWALKAGLSIPRDKFLARDLKNPLELGRRFDLALSLEVGEHLPAASAPSFVQGLCGAADTVLFSAAIPGQGGRHHVNEQWPAYWHKLFEECGYDCYDVIRSRVWSNPRVLWYYAQNCLVFARRTTPMLGSPVDPPSLVHPTLWSAAASRWNSPGKLLERLPKAAISRLSRKPS